MGLPLYRNIRARSYLEVFLLSAISSLLLVRFFLHLTGYPQLGGNGLHIAHMLWGGLLMMVAIVLVLSFIGSRVQQVAAILGGIGFGIFIDELGKFLTSDNDYFFKPAVGIMYAIFISLYLAFNFLSRQQRLSSREYQLNALLQFEEAVLKHMDPLEKARARALLAQADQRSSITKHLQAFLDKVDTIPAERPSILANLLDWLDARYRHFWGLRRSNRLVGIFFLVQIGIFIVAVGWSIFTNVDGIGNLLQTGTSYARTLLIGQLVSSVVAAAFAINGAFLLPVSRTQAFEQFRRATLVNLFLTEFFIFSRIQFSALPGFVFTLAVLLLITYVLVRERPSESVETLS